MLFTPTPIPATTALGRSWALVLGGLCTFVAHFASRLPAHAALLARVYHRLIHTTQRLDRLALRWQTNTLPTPRPLRAGQKRVPAPSSPPRLPRANTWLIRLVQPTAQFAGQVAALLADPEIRALHQAAPQAGRLLRPLCRALGIPPPDWLTLPTRPPRAHPARPPRPRRTANPATWLLPTDRPLPPSVIAAARAWRRKPA